MPSSPSMRCHVPSGANDQASWSSARSTRRISSRRARRRWSVIAQHGFDPPVEVARHEVGRADEVLGRFGAGLAEAEDPRVLEVPADDRSHADGLREPGHPGRRQQMPRTIRSIARAGAATPRRARRSCSGSTRRSSSSMIRPSVPSRLRRGSARRSSTRSDIGATRSLRYSPRPAVAGQVVEQLASGRRRGRGRRRAARGPRTSVAVFGL